MEFRLMDHPTGSRVIEKLIKQRGSIHTAITKKSAVVIRRVTREDFFFRHMLQGLLGSACVLTDINFYASASFYASA